MQCEQKPSSLFLLIRLLLSLFLMHAFAWLTVIKQLMMSNQRNITLQTQGGLRPDKVKGHRSQRGQSRVSGVAGPGLGKM